MNFRWEVSSVVSRRCWSWPAIHNQNGVEDRHRDHWEIHWWCSVLKQLIAINWRTTCFGKLILSHLSWFNMFKYFQTKAKPLAGKFLLAQKAPEFDSCAKFPTPLGTPTPPHHFGPRCCTRKIQPKKIPAWSPLQAWRRCPKQLPLRLTAPSNTIHYYTHIHHKYIYIYTDLSYIRYIYIYIYCHIICLILSYNYDTSSNAFRSSHIIPSLSALGRHPKCLKRRSPFSEGGPDHLLGRGGSKPSQPAKHPTKMDPTRCATELVLCHRFCCKWIDNWGYYSTCSIFLEPKGFKSNLCTSPVCLLEEVVIYNVNGIHFTIMIILPCHTLAIWRSDVTSFPGAHGQKYGELSNTYMQLYMFSYVPFMMRVTFLPKVCLDWILACIIYMLMFIDI